MKKTIICILMLSVIIIAGCGNDDVEYAELLVNQTKQTIKLTTDLTNKQTEITTCQTSLQALNKTYEHTKDEFAKLKQLKLDTAKVTIKTNYSGCSTYIETIKGLEKDRNEFYWLNISDTYNTCSTELNNCTARIEKAIEDLER